MAFERRDQLVVQYQTRDFVLSDAEKDAYEEDLVLLARIVEPFPAAHLHVEVAHRPRSNRFEVRTQLLLANNLNFVVAEDDELHRTAFKRCVRRLIEDVEAYKDRRSAREPQDRTEVPTREVRATVEPDVAAMQAAVARGEYKAFHAAISIYRESLRGRIGRRIEMFPDAAARLDVDFSIGDIVEDVFLTAYERFDQRQTSGESLGEWLEKMIDDSIRSLAEDPDRRRNISWVRAALKAVD